MPDDPKCGICCSCGYDGPVETTCQKRQDETHCNHWWDWCVEPDCPTCPKERFDMPNVYDDGHRVVQRVEDKLPTKGGAHAFYEVGPHESSSGETQQLHGLDFQHDTIPAVGVCGWTNEAVLAVVIDRLEGFQAGEFACTENEDALSACRRALHVLENRTIDRKKRGVEGKHEA